MKRASVVNEHFEFVSKKEQKMEKSETPMDLSVIVDHDRISKNSSLNLVELAKEIEKANSYVKHSTCTKLKLIADQMRHLQHEAECILKESRRNLLLHEASCNFIKQPGHIYHLYQRSSGELYFSMISPEEWGEFVPTQQYKGSYRLEPDQTWTSVSEISDLDSEMKVIHNIVENTIFGDSKLPILADSIYN